MSTRALRRAYKDNELSPKPEAVPSNNTGSEEEEDDDEEQESPQIVSRQNLFSLLNGGDNDNEDENIDEGQEEDQDEDRDIDVTTNNDEDEVESSKNEDNDSSTLPTKKSKSKKSKKKKKKLNSTIATSNSHGHASLSSPASGDDAASEDIDKLISQMNDSASLKDRRPPTYLKFLQLDTKDLDYEHEFRKLFGKAALRESQQASATTTAAAALPRSRSGSPVILNSWGGRDGRSIPGTSRKLVLTRIKDHYIPIVRRDILMEQLTSQENEIAEFKFVHSSEYQKAQRIYEFTRSLGDIENMVNQVMMIIPYHIPTLLVLANNRTQTGNHSEAADYLEKCLLTFDRGLKSNFNFTTGQCRLPFKYFENRSFYLVIFEYIKSLMRRGTWQTAFAYTKLLWGLDPEDDPYGAGLMIDFFAMNAGNYQYIIDISDEPFFTRSGGYYTRSNLSYSQALAYYTTESKSRKAGGDSTSSTAGKFLAEAISSFPWVAIDILGYHHDEEDWTISNYEGIFSKNILDGVIDKTKLIPLAEQCIYSSLYATQMKIFWQVPEVRQWLLDVCKSLKHLEPIHQSIGISLSLVRYVMLSQQTQTFRYIPKELLEGEIWTDDLFPPADNISPYPIRSFNGEVN